ncbi:Ribonuclease 3-like protein 3 [Tetrabaena socialis]|uniref:Ribonuclease 3-like protein 3 n=1 Tax=Tetrabaena socialis TaxID=47790 RepID=A0A2J8AHJ8_9CHLO|nr:Ribonuclease 3-like protein 3 [Tetrabaena socialis]|eukprot:PNH11989.1 Ribonuclease 3-like protein 3 [Tetrabaena socialis]
MEALVGAQLLLAAGAAAAPAAPLAPAPQPHSHARGDDALGDLDIPGVLEMGLGAASEADAAGRLHAALLFCVGMQLLPPDSPAVAPPGSRLDRLHAAGVAAAEAALGYVFDDPALCGRALTHVSWPSREAGAHYQLLEFLGDAVLGLVASLWVFRYGGSPRQMSERREALVRNETLAAAAVSAELHAALRARQRELSKAVQDYAEARSTVVRRGAAEGTAAGGAAAAAPWLATPELGVALAPADGGGGGDAAAVIVRAPKVLADVVEALIGAVFLDSGGDLAACEQAIHRLLLAHLNDGATLIGGGAAAAGSRSSAAHSPPAAAAVGSFSSRRTALAGPADLACSPPLLSRQRGGYSAGPLRRAGDMLVRGAAAATHMLRPTARAAPQLMMVVVAEQGRVRRAGRAFWRAALL